MDYTSIKVQVNEQELGPKMNFNHLRVFHIVAESQNFSHAAERLNISQPAVSMQIRKLEESLGVPLVQTYGRHLKLTEAGKILKDYANRIFVLSQEAQRAMNEIRGLERGHLLLGASTTPGAYLLPPYIGRYKQKFPGVDLTLKISNTQTIQEKLANGEMDLGVIGETPHVHADLVFEPWLTDHLVLIVYPEHPFAEKDEIELGELVEEPFILREQGSSTRNILENRLQQTGIQLSVVMELDNTEAVKHAVSIGLGISILSEHTVTWETKVQRLKKIPICDAALKRTLNVAYHVGRRHSRTATAFLELLR